MRALVNILILAIALGASACGNGELSRAKVIKLMDQRDHKSIIVKHFLSKDGKAAEETEIGKKYLAHELITYQFVKRTSKSWRTVRASTEVIIKPTTKLANAIYSYQSIRWENHDRSVAGTAIEEVKLYVGDVSNMEVKGIKSDANDINKRLAEIELTIKSNDIGREFYGTEFTFPLIVEFVLYDDGWRYERTLWEASKKKSSFMNNDLYALDTPARVNNAVLWNMHKLGVYSKDWEILAKKLAKSDKYYEIGTAAWAFHDNGNTEKGIKLYESKVMPMVKVKGDPEVSEKFQKYFQSMKGSEPLMQVLARKEKNRLEGFNEWQNSVEIAKQKKELDEKARQVRKAEQKAEREKKRKLASQLRESEQKEKARITALKKEAITKTKSLGTFSCLSSTRNVDQIEATDIGYQSTSNGYVGKCSGGDGLQFLRQKGSFAKDDKCRNSYGRRYPCVGFTVEGESYLTGEVFFENIGERDKFFAVVKKAHLSWLAKYRQLLD